MLSSNQYMSSTKDIDYIREVLSGNTQAYTHLVNNHKDMVYSIALKIIRNESEAEEIAQDTFIKAYQTLSKFKGTAKFSTWLYRIAYNGAISHMRKRKPETTTMEHHAIENLAVEPVQEKLDAKEHEQKLKILHQVLAQLPEDENLLMTLFYLENHSIEEISEITSLTTNNVKVKLHRIRKRMYKSFSDLLTTSGTVCLI